MYQKILHFIKYNNGFVIILGIFFFSFGISFAVSPEMRNGVYSSEETVVSVDNGPIISADLDNFNFNLRINSVTEDEKNYYAVYSYQTLAIEDGFWQNKEIEKTLTVSKEALAGKDLGLYVAQELGENINYELSYLKRVQKLEKEKGESQKIVAVAYSGLIGKLLNPKEETIEGYSPVIPEPVLDLPAGEAGVPATVELNPAAVIVSTPYSEQQPAESPEDIQAGSPQSEDSGGGEPESVLTSTPSEEPAESPPEPAQEATSTSPSLPAPEEMVDEELIQEVVEELLQSEATSTPASEDTSTPEVIPEPVIEAASTPEIVPEPEPAPEPAPTPVLEPATPAPEPAPEPTPENTPEPTPLNIETNTQ